MRAALDSILEEWLPTKWSRLLAGTSLTLAAAFFWIPEFLQNVGIPTSKETALLLRLSLPPALLCVGLFAVLWLVVSHHHSSVQTPSKVENLDDLFIKVLILVAQYHSQEIPATPDLIAKDIGLDPELTLAHMWKYHNEQFITFRSGGAKPDTNTAFFLSPKAWQCTKIVRA